MNWKDIINPVIVAIILGIGAMVYNKFEAYEELLKKLPQVEEDLKRVEEAHKENNSGTPIGYTSFKSKTRFRLEILENKKTNLSPVYNVLKRDSLEFIKIHNRLEYLKNLH